jgi:hypothetical protein
MFFASVAKPNPDGGEEPDVFAYFLADRLGRTLAELEEMPHAEYLGWQSYHKVRQQQDELAVLRATRG